MSVGAKVVFIDRDGVLNKYPGHGKYVCSVKDFEFIPGSLEGIKKLSLKGFRLAVISNQSGVAKGLYTKQELDKMDKMIYRALKKENVVIDGIYYCTHGAEENCSCRKPKAGLLEQAVSRLKTKPMVSFFIGDSFSDMRTALDFGAKPVLVLSGREKISNRANWEFEPDYVFDNLLVAAHYICAHYG